MVPGSPNIRPGATRNAKKKSNMRKKTPTKRARGVQDRKKDVQDQKTNLALTWCQHEVFGPCQDTELPSSPLKHAKQYVKASKMPMGSNAAGAASSVPDLVRTVTPCQGSNFFRFWLGGAAPQTPRILAGGGFAPPDPPLDGFSRGAAAPRTPRVFFFRL